MNKCYKPRCLLLFFSILMLIPVLCSYNIFCPIEAHSDFRVNNINDMKKYEIGCNSRWSIDGKDYDLTLIRVDYHFETIYQDEHINKGISKIEVLMASADYRDERPLIIFNWISYFVIIGLIFLIIGYLVFLFCDLWILSFMKVIK